MQAGTGVGNLAGLQGGFADGDGGDDGDVDDGGDDGDVDDDDDDDGGGGDYSLIFTMAIENC